MFRLFTFGESDATSVGTVALLLDFPKCVLFVSLLLLSVLVDLAPLVLLHFRMQVIVTSEELLWVVVLLWLVTLMLVLEHDHGQTMFCHVLGTFPLLFL